MKKVLVGGVFSVIHPGHLYLLKKAKSLGNYLIVVVANDKNVKKGYSIPAEKRKDQLEKLGFIDNVIIGDENDKSKIVKEEKPDIIALGYDQKLEIKKPDNCMIIRIKKEGDYSTRKIMKGNK